MCNRCSSQLEPICCYQWAQRCLKHQLRSNPIDSWRKASAEKHSVEHGAHLIVVLGGGWKRLSNSSGEQSQHCYHQHPDLPANIPAFFQFQEGKGEERGGVRATITQFSPSFHLFFFFVLLQSCPRLTPRQQYEARTAVVIGHLFAVIKERIPGESLPHSSSLHHLFLSFSSPLLSLPRYSMVSYLCGNVATLHWLTPLSDNTGGRQRYHSAVWLTPIKE